MRKNSVCRFYGFVEGYDMVNIEALWGVLRMYDVGVKLEWN